MYAWNSYEHKGYSVSSYLELVHLIFEVRIVQRILYDSISWSLMFQYKCIIETIYKTSYL